MRFFSNIRCAIHCIHKKHVTSTQVAASRKASSKLSRASTCSPTRWISSASHGSDRPGRVWSWLSSAHAKVDVAPVARCWSRPRRAVLPQDLRAGTQHRPMEMRRAGMAFITWRSVCASSVSLHISISRRMTSHTTDVPSILA